MAPWAEQTQGPEKNGTTGTIRYRAHECTLAADAQTAALAQATTDYATGPFGAWTFQSASLQFCESPGEWNCTLTYGPPGGTRTEPPATSSTPTYRFQVGRDRRKTMFSIKTKGRYKRGTAGSTSAPDMYGMINVSDKGVEGCDLGDTSGALLFSITHYIPAATVTNDYIDGLSAMVWHYNEAAFEGFDASCVLFLGASGAKRGVGDWEVAFEFAARKGVADACLEWSADSGFGNGHNGGVAIPVGAWDYLWAYYKKEPVTIDGKTVALYRPKYLYVEQIYYPGDFTLLSPT